VIGPFLFRRRCGAGWARKQGSKEARKQGSKEARKVFFFEKKKQKTFAHWGAWVGFVMPETEHLS
jgi:hypothetical protein